eukprot:TRINITY_DN4571_c0_g1_i1.p1 TRINITY_DN4571_c0_g1~~TRINITY_DN4571_c0_g1_i1.p1  ORF type:complete len:784 (-),score=156.67 TRINITY_DN4571_c0_g1_i1:29-2221(-)
MANESLNDFYGPLANSIVSDDLYLFFYNDEELGGIILGVVAAHYPNSSRTLRFSMVSDDLLGKSGVAIYTLEDPRGDDEVIYSSREARLSATLNLRGERAAFGFGPFNTTAFCFDLLVTQGNVNFVTFVATVNATRIPGPLNRVLQVCHANCSTILPTSTCGTSRFTNRNFFPLPVVIDNYEDVCGECNCRTPWTGECCAYPLPLDCAVQNVIPLETRNVASFNNNTGITNGSLTVSLSAISLTTRASWLSLGLGIPPGSGPSPSHYNYDTALCSCWNQTTGLTVTPDGFCQDTWTLNGNWSTFRDQCCNLTQNDVFYTIYDCSVRAEFIDIVPGPIFEPRPIPDRFTGALFPLLIRFERAVNASTPILIFESENIFAYISVQDNTYLLTGEILLQVTFLAAYPYQVNFLDLLSITPLNTSGAGSVTVLPGYPTFGELTDPYLPYVKCDNQPNSVCYQAVQIRIRPDPGTCRLDAVYDLAIEVVCRNVSGCTAPSDAVRIINATFTSERFCPEITLDTLLDGNLQTYSNNFTDLQQSFALYRLPTTGNEQGVCLLGITSVSAQSPGTNAQISNSFFLNLGIQNQAGSLVTLYTSNGGPCSVCGPNNANLRIDTLLNPDVFPDLPPNQAGACFTLTQGSNGNTGLVDPLLPLTGNPTSWNIVATLGVTYGQTKRSSTTLDNLVGVHVKVSIKESGSDETANVPTLAYNGGSVFAANVFLLLVAVFFAVKFN